MEPIKVDGIVDIPLPGNAVVPVVAQDAAAMPIHFLVGPENRLVEAAVRAILHREADACNPLVLYGPSGTGKSHLARGIAAAWKTRHRRQRVVSTTAVDFARELAEAIETQGVEEFRDRHRSAALLVVEDLGMLMTRKREKLSAQEELIHTVDALTAERRWVVATASAPPTELSGIHPMLQSRLMSGLTIRLAPPGLETRLALLKQWAALRDIVLTESAARVLAEGVGGTAAELAGALAELAVSEDIGDGRLDSDAARRYLARRNGGRRPSLHEIALAVARHFSVRLSDLRSSARRRALVTARGVAAYLARRFAGMTVKDIGNYFGGRDHATVIYGCNKTEEWMETDATVRQAVEQLRKTLWKN
jgi:chromosomal replication initiator protein